MDTPDVPALLPLIRQTEIESPLRESRISYLVSTIDADAAEYFQLHRERNVIMGARI